MTLKSMSALAVTLLASPVLLLGQAGDATTVLADMQAALGGADKVAAVRTLIAEGTIQRVTPKGTTEFALELALELPDKFVARTQLTNQGNMSVYRSAGFNGDGLINETDAPPSLATAGLKGRKKLSSTAPRDSEATTRRLMAAAQHDFARLALGMFGSSFAGFPVQFSHAGMAESPDGSAHVVVARGEGDFDVRLFVDTGTSLPLMMTWSEAAPKDATTMVEHRFYYSNFKPVGDLTLPHTLQRWVDGTPTEETTFATFEINTAIDGDRFKISRQYGMATLSVAEGGKSK